MAAVVASANVWYRTLIVYVVAGGIQVYLDVVNDNEFSDSDDPQLDLDLTDATFRLNNIGEFLEVISNVLLLITLVELGNGFLYCLAGARSTAQKILRFAAYGYGFLLLVLGVAFFGLETAAWNIYFGFQSDGGFSQPGEDDTQASVVDATNAKLKTARQLITVFDILHWIGTIAVVVFASYIVHKCKNSNLLRYVSLSARSTLSRPHDADMCPPKQSAILFLVATILDFVRCVWDVAYDATWVLPDQDAVTPLWLAIVEPILDTWPVFVLLVLLFTMGVRKKDGLWSTQQQQQQQQSWNGTGVQGVAAPAGFNGGFAPQPVWQVQPQVVQQHGQQYPQQYAQQYPPQYYQQYPQQHTGYSVVQPPSHEMDSPSPGPTYEEVHEVK